MSGKIIRKFSVLSLPSSEWVSSIDIIKFPPSSFAKDNQFRKENSFHKNWTEINVSVHLTRQREHCSYLKCSILNRALSHFSSISLNWSETCNSRDYFVNFFISKIGLTLWACNSLWLRIKIFSLRLRERERDCVSTGIIRQIITGHSHHHYPLPPLDPGSRNIFHNYWSLYEGAVEWYVESMCCALSLLSKHNWSY